MHHISFTFSVEGNAAQGIRINHEFGRELLALPTKKLVHLLRLLRQFAYHSLLVPIEDKGIYLDTITPLDSYIEIELTGELSMSSNDYVLDANIDPTILSLPKPLQAQIFGALVMFIDQAGVMFVRQAYGALREASL